MLGDQVRGWYSVDERSAGVHRASTSASSPRPSAGRRTSTTKAVDAAGREDVGAKKPTDEAQAEDEDAEDGEES